MFVRDADSPIVREIIKKLLYKPNPMCSKAPNPTFRPTGAGCRLHQYSLILVLVLKLQPLCLKNAIFWVSCPFYCRFSPVFSIAPCCPLAVSSSPLPHATPNLPFSHVFPKLIPIAASNEGVTHGFFLFQVDAQRDGEKQVSAV